MNVFFFYNRGCSGACMLFALFVWHRLSWNIIELTHRSMILLVFSQWVAEKNRRFNKKTN